MEQLTMKFRKYERMEREDRKDQLYSVVSRSEVPLVLLEIARRAGLCKSNHVRALLEELVESGDLVHGPLRAQPNGIHAITYVATFRTL